MGILRGNSWLSDEHIVHAQWLLKKQYLGTNGLHSVLAIEGKKVATERACKLCACTQYRRKSLDNSE